MRNAKHDLKICKTMMPHPQAHEALPYWIQRAEKAEAENARLQAAVDVTEKAHLLCIDELTEAQEENKKLRAALSELVQACMPLSYKCSVKTEFDVAMESAQEALREGE